MLLVSNSSISRNIPIISTSTSAVAIAVTGNNNKVKGSNVRQTILASTTAKNKNIKNSNSNNSNNKAAVKLSASSLNQYQQPSLLSSNNVIDTVSFTMNSSKSESQKDKITPKSNRLRNKGQSSKY